MAVSREEKTTLKWKVERKFKWCECAIKKSTNVSERGKLRERNGKP